MNELLSNVLGAHGGLERWKKLDRVSATIVSGGGLLPMKGLEIDPKPLLGTATTRTESTVIEPFGQPDWRMVFTPDRVAIETTAGVLINERLEPRAAFAGHTMNAAWDMLHRAYFNGYARWTYLNTPFLMALPGFEVIEIPPWRGGPKNGEACAHASLMDSPAIAKNRIFTSVTIFCSVPRLQPRSRGWSSRSVIRARHY